MKAALDMTTAGLAGSGFLTSGFLWFFKKTRFGFFMENLVFYGFFMVFYIFHFISLEKLYLSAFESLQQ